MVEIDSIADLLCNIKEAMKTYFYTKSQTNDLLDDKADSNHNHDTRYYNISTMDTKLAQKADSNHNHDDRYYSKTVMDDALADKAPLVHTHPIDSAIIADSSNPVKNSVIKSALDNKASIDHNHNAATASAAGFMSTEMFVKLRDIQPEANKTIVDSSLNNSSTNPVQNKVINTALNNKAGLDVATQSSKGLMSSTDKTKLDGIDTNATKNKITVGLLLTCSNDATNQGLIVIKKGTNLKMQLYYSKSDRWDTSDATFLTQEDIHFNLNGGNYVRTSGTSMRIDLAAGEYPMNFVFHGTKYFYPLYRTIILRIDP